MLNSAEQRAKEILHSLPIPVRFFGFEGTTLSLAASGWELSMRQFNSHFGMEMQLAMKIGREFEEMFALSAPIRVDFGDLHRMTDNRHHYAEFLSRLYFEIQYVAPGFKFRIMPQMGNASSFLNSWQGVDARPQVREETEIDIRNFKFFKMANPSLKDIIVSPEQVPELMNMVLKAQEATMKEVRAREKSRENLQKFREEMMDVKPAHRIQAQIITLCA